MICPTDVLYIFKNCFDSHSCHTAPSVLPAVYVLYVFCLHFLYLLYIFGTGYSVHKMNIAVLSLGLSLLAREVAAGAQAPSPPLGGLPQEEGSRSTAPANSFSAHSKLHLLGECCFVCGHFIHQQYRIFLQEFSPGHHIFLY